MMRLRNDTLPVGRLLTYFDPEDRGRNRSLLFLVAGAADIEPLTRIEAASREAISDLGLGGVAGHRGPAPGLLPSIHPSLAPSRVARLEVAEMADVLGNELDQILRQVLPRIA